MSDAADPVIKQVLSKAMLSREIATSLRGRGWEVLMFLTRPPKTDPLLMKLNRRSRSHFGKPENTVYRSKSLLNRQFVGLQSKFDT